MRLIIIICISTVLGSLNGQVLVRCAGGSFSAARCVPTEESAIDSVHITPCDCDEPRNLHGYINACARTLTICADNPIIPEDIDAFNYPYYALDPGSLLGLLGPNNQELVYFMDTTRTLDAYSSASSQDDAALILEIDQNTKCATFELWVPMDEEYAIKVYRDAVSGPNDFDIITIPASGEECNRTYTTCYSIKSDDTPKTIPSNGSISSDVILPIAGQIADINIKNVDISHPNIGDLKIRFISPWFGVFSDNVIFYDPLCEEVNLNIGFDLAGIEEIPCPQVDGVMYKPLSNLYRPTAELRNINDDPENEEYLNWALRVENESNSVGTLNEWELEVCYVTPRHNIFKSSDHAPIDIPNPNPSGSGNIEDLQIITSTITIPQSGIISSIGIEHLDISHNYISDLRVSLRNPTGDTIILVDRMCLNQDDIKINFYDHAYLDTVSCGNMVPRPPSKPHESFSEFLGLEVQGDWILIVEDFYGIEGGSLNSWGLNINVDCIDNYANSNVIKGSRPYIFTYQAKDSIISEERIIDNAINNPNFTTTANYKAGKTILLQNEFQVEQGQIFQASIEDCTNN